jgi:membrane-associated phospholipid phosphatase
VTPISPLSLRFSCKAVTLFLLATFAAFFLAGYFDTAAYLALVDVDVDDTDWNRMFRTLGFLPFWLLAALGLALADGMLVRMKNWGLAMSRSALLAMAVAGSGVMAELLKIVIRRERPFLHDGQWGWRSIDNFFDSSNLGMPSSHAIVAFAASWMLCRLFPRATLLWIAIAIGCAATRVLNHAHFISDTVISAAVAFAIVRTLWFWHMYNHRQDQLPSAPSA